MIGILSVVIPLILIGLVVRFVIGRTRATDAPVARIVGAVAHVGVVLAAANAVADLIEVALPGREIFEDTTRLVALDLATLVVAGPIAYVLWKTLFAEREDFPRRLAVVGGLAASMVVTLLAVVRAVRGILPDVEFSRASFGTLVGFGLAWAGYEWLRARETEPLQVSDLRETAGSATGLGLTVSGLVLLIETALTEALGLGGDVIFDRSVAERLGTVAILLVVGLAAFVWFWLRDLSRRETRFRNGYAAVVSFVGVAALASSVAIVVFLGLEWVFGLGEETAARQFEALPVSTAAVIVAGAVWGHHLGVLGTRRGLATRAYSYLTAATGIAATVGGLVTLISVAIEAMTTDSIVTTGGIGSVALAGAIATGVGALLWWRERRHVDLSDPEERQSLPRRLYLTGLLVVSGLTGGIALVMALFGLIQGALEGNLSVDTIFDGRFVIALVVTTAPLVWYLLSEIHADREARPIEAERRSALVIAGDRGPFTNGQIHFVARADGHGHITPEVAASIDAILTESGPPVVITVDDDGVQVVEVESVP